MPSTFHEKQFWRDGISVVAGVDEVGRGALAGPVVAAAVVLSPDLDDSLLEQLDDSKKLTATKRKQLFEALRKCGVEYALGVYSSETIDEVGILAATALAMQSAIAKLPRPPAKLLIDGRRMPQFGKNATFLIKGDSISCSIAAASIIAKVTRDEMMTNEFNKRYPQYGFAQNKGYGTKQHINAINQHGASPIHRRSFNPLRTLLTQPQLFP